MEAILDNAGAGQNALEQSAGLGLGGRDRMMMPQMIAKPMGWAAAGTRPAGGGRRA